MAIQADPNNDLTVLGTYSKPILVGPEYNPFAEDLVVCLKSPATSGGPGGIRESASLPIVAAMLKAFSNLIPQLTVQQQSAIQAALASLQFEIPIQLQKYIDDAVNYITALKGRDAFLQQVLTGVMNATK